MQIKRSMAVHPAPIVLDGERVREPTPKELYLKHGGEHEWSGEWGYRITRVTNSVDFHPGWVISKDHVRALIEDGWTISVLTG